MPSSSSILINGAGVFGLTAAIELRRRGWGVTVIDPGPIPRPEAASTDISKVVRADYGSDAGYTELGLKALDGWREWNQQWNETVYREDGFLVLTRDEPQRGSFEYDSHKTLTALGQSLGTIEPGWEQRFPSWKSNLYSHGYLNPRGGWAASGRAVELLARDARAAGVDIREHQTFGRFVERAAKVIGLRTESGETIHADFTLMATGAWTATLLPELRDVLWATGQPVVHFKVENPDDFRPPKFSVWAADIGTTGWYGFPSLADGTLKIANHGPGRPIHPDDPRTILPEEEERFRQFAATTFPALKNAPIVERRLCLYGDSFDGNFWIDHHPDRPGLVIATGDSGHAFKFAPVLGKVIADIVERKPHSLSERFAWRDPSQVSAESARFKE
ncbi:MAG: sarcosine oxidase [Verrucomicrobiales bacterium]|nr:sarcosine oxidase [Verrucomicrobiales bacterium]